MREICDAGLTVLFMKFKDGTEGRERVEECDRWVSNNTAEAEKDDPDRVTVSESLHIRI